jgi:hypothetical protein
VPPKKKGKSARSHYMISDFTPEEKRQIVDYCNKKQISISKFLAGIALAEVHRASKKGTTEEQLTITLKIPSEKNAKLQIFAHRQEKTLQEFLEALIMPTLEKEKVSFTSTTTSLRCYLSPEEHRLLKNHLKSRNLSARTYISFLALKALGERGTK